MRSVVVAVAVAVAVVVEEGWQRRKLASAIPLSVLVHQHQSSTRAHPHPHHHHHPLCADPHSFLSWPDATGLSTCESPTPAPHWLDIHPHSSVSPDHTPSATLSPLSPSSFSSAAVSPPAVQRHHGPSTLPANSSLAPVLLLLRWGGALQPALWVWETLEREASRVLSA